VSTKPSPALLRAVVILMLIGALACMAYGTWMMATDEGAPLAVFIAGALLGALASVFAGQLKKR
jgi:uncharacterized membrane protein YjjB (DUF3815 family)